MYKTKRSVPRAYKIERHTQMEQVARVPVLCIAGLGVVAVAHTKSAESRVWDIIDRNAGAWLCQVRGRGEAHRVLISHARAAGLEPTEPYH